MDLSRGDRDHWVAWSTEDWKSALSLTRPGIERDRDAYLSSRDHANLGSSYFARWIAFAARAARAGYVQWVVLSLSLIWIAACLVRRPPRSPASRSRCKAKSKRAHSSIELASQVTRAAAFVCICGGSAGSEPQAANIALLGFAFVVGLFRLVNNVYLWQLALSQSNILLTAALVTLLAADLLPRLVISVDLTANPWVLAAIITVAVSLFLAFLAPREWVPPPPDLRLLQRLPETKPSPEETCSLFNYYLTYEWLTPLVWKGSRRPVAMEDLPSLPWYDDPMCLLDRLQTARAKHTNSTFWTVASYLKRELTAMALWVGFSFAVDVISPFALYQLLAYLADPAAAVLHPGTWLFLMFAGPMSKSISFQQYVFIGTRVIVRIRSGLTQELYRRAMSSMELDHDVLADLVARKSPRDKKPAQKSTSAGRLANLMASDIDAVYQLRDIVMLSVGVPVGILMSLVALYRIVGWSSLVGTAVLLGLMPVPAWMAHLVGNSQRKVKRAQDSRISLISEYLESLRTIKMFAWEDAMIKTINEARKREMKDLWHIWVLWLIMSEFTALIPMLAMLAIFVTYVTAMGAPLTAPVAFTTMSLTMTLRRNMNMISRMSRNITNGLISIGRLDKYIANTVPITHYPEGPLRIQKATFRRSRNASFRLCDISVDFVQGGLNALLGRSGSGKTTLLLSILGETVLEEGLVVKPADVAFASQTAWLQNESIRDNILFGAPMEEARYGRIVAACCLEADCRELPGGDLTEVGENGVALSGGQRSRIALARALYSRASLLLLDDIFSALDSKTAAAVWKMCFCSDLLRDRTVLLVTQLQWIEAQADLAITLEDGTIKRMEQNLGVVRTPIRLSETAGNVIPVTRPHELGIGNGHSPHPSPNQEQTSSGKVPKEDEVAHEMHASVAVGSGRLLFFRYMLYFGGPLYVSFAFLIVLMSNAALIGTSLWLSRWVDAYNREAAVDIAFYLGVYAALSITVTLSESVAFLTYAKGSWVAAKRLHEMFLQAVMHVSVSWYKNVPVGRIVNRFSRDMNSLDTALNRMLLMTLDGFVRLFFRLGAISSILPIFILPSVVTCFIGVVAGEMYTRTAVTVKRLVSSSQSPLFSQFADTLTGLPIIRARSGMREVFGGKLAERMRAFSRASEANYNCNRWVALRIEFAGALVTFCAGWIAVSKAHVLAAGLVGFSMANATSLSETILGLVRSMNDVEIELQSFYRVQEYASLPPEEKTEDASHNEDGYRDEASYVVPADWPRTSAVEFRNVTIRYTPDGPDILKDINLKFNAGERVAIVGRTGSGKSTLVLSLLRFTHVASGQILFDGVDITAVPRKRLRQSLTIIPQDAVLFNGTVGSNLDPTGKVDAATLEHTLAACRHIASFQFQGKRNIEAEEGDDNEVASSGISATPPHHQQDQQGITLSTAVTAKGENFSHGQRQVLSLCRALVRRSKLMLLDEATASMDYETDQAIQDVLRRDMAADQSVSENEFGGSRTLVTIAHRLRTIADYDKVVVIASGRVVECGSPKELFVARGSFYDMVCHSGERDELERIMVRGMT